MKLKYIAWRNGRPRFSPHASLRSEGYKSKDLKHGDGRWFTAEEAADWSANFESKRVRWPGARTLRNPNKEQELADRRGEGFVYFLWAGDRIKVGFSTKPISRASQLLLGVGHNLRMFVTLPGSIADERRLHKRLGYYRARGEWFLAAPKALEVIAMEIGMAIEVRKKQDENVRHPVD